MQNTIIDLDVSKLFDIKDYNNEVDLVHFRDQYYKVQEILEETNKFYINFVKSKLKPLQYYWSNPYITSAIKPYSFKVYKNVVDIIDNNAEYDWRGYGCKRQYNDLEYVKLTIKADVAKELIAEIKSDKKCPFYFDSTYKNYIHDNSDFFRLSDAKLKIGDYPISSTGDIDLWKTRGSWMEAAVKDDKGRLKAAKLNGFASQKECKDVINKYIDFYSKKATTLINERFNNFLLSGDLTNKFIIGVKLDDLTQIVSSLCSPEGYAEYLRIISPKSRQHTHYICDAKGNRTALIPEKYYFKNVFWAKKIEHHQDTRYHSQDKNDYSYLQLNVDFNIADYFDDTYTRENFVKGKVVSLRNPLRPKEDTYGYDSNNSPKTLINYEKVKAFVDDYMKEILEKVYEIIYKYPRKDNNRQNDAMYVMYKGSIRYFCKASEMQNIQVSISKNGDKLNCWLSTTSGHSSWGKHTDTHHSVSISFDIYTNEIVDYSNNTYTTSYGVDMDLDDFD